MSHTAAPAKYRDPWYQTHWRGQLRQAKQSRPGQLHPEDTQGRK